MLPFLMKSKEGSASMPVETKKREPDNQENEDLDLLGETLKELLDAIHKKDLKAMTHAFKAACEIVDSQPHLEGDHLG